MLDKIGEKSGWYIVAGLMLVFVFLHLPGLDISYHQDEYKWAEYVNPAISQAGGIPHPPIGEFVYHHIGSVVGYDNLRFVPFIFGLANVALIYILCGIIYNRKAAVFTAFLFVGSFYSLLASLMVDTDGALMPFFFLLSSIFYYKWKDSDFAFKSKWLALLFIAVVLGFLTKESFILPIFAFALDFAMSNGVFADRKRFTKYLTSGIVGFLGLIGALMLSKLIFPFFDFKYFLSFIPRFLNFENRGWLQTFIQFSKSLMYLSPLLVLPLVFLDKEIAKRGRPLILFILTGLVFYLFAFDFSVGALDRYFQFLIIPLVILVGASLSNTLGNISRKNWIFIAVVTISIFLTQFLNHFVPALHPKSEWLTRVVGLKWNFLFPFTGGSGPAGFYVSFLFIALAWVASIVFAVAIFRKPNFKKTAAVGMLLVGLVYNSIFIEEYLFGRVNGNAQVLLEEARAYVVENDLDRIVVYNDIGGYEYRKMGIYERRLYAAPGFEAGYREFFKDFSGYVVYIDIPKIEEGSYYSDYLDSCEVVFEDEDQYMTSKILEC